MLNQIVTLIVSLGVMSLSELMPRETKVKYVESGKKWSTVYIVSLLSGLLCGALVIYTTNVNNLPMNYKLTFLVMTVISAYVAGQATITDTALHLVDRRVLRIAYVIALIITIYMVRLPENLVNGPNVVMAYAIVIITFLFINIGASDVRSLAVVVPFTTSIIGETGLIILMGILLLIFSVQWFLQHKARGEVPLPVAYTIIWPYVIAFIAIPFFM